MTPQPFSFVEAMIADWQYIAGSPGEKYGGFSRRIVSIAKRSLREFRRFQRLVARMPFRKGSGVAEQPNSKGLVAVTLYEGQAVMSGQVTVRVVEIRGRHGRRRVRVVVQAPQGVDVRVESGVAGFDDDE